MADFWIKVEKGTPDKPEILELSAILNISDPDTVTGKMVRVWSWFDSNSENGHAPSVTNVLLDRLTGVTGFTDALVTVGWLEKTETGYLVTHFDRHLGNGAKKRASDAERKRKSRQRSQECHTESVTENRTKIGPDKSREDKSREEESKDITSGKPDNSVSKIDYSVLQCTSEEIKEIKRIRRANKGGAITQRVANALAKEFNKALDIGYSLDECLNEWKVRGWKSFKAEWLKPKPGTALSQYSEVTRQNIENLKGW